MGLAARGSRPLPAVQGRHHPARRRATWTSGARWRGRPARRSTRTSSRSSRPAASSPRTTCSAASSPRRSTASGLTHRGHPRHLLPVPARRASTPSPRRSAAPSRTSPRTPIASRRCATIRSLIPAAVEELLRWETPVPGVHARRDAATSRSAGTTIPAGQTGHLSARDRQHRRGRVPRPGRRRLRPRRRTATSRSAGACTAASARTSLAWRCASRSRSSTGGCPRTRCSEGETPVYSMGIRGVEYLPLVWEPALMRVHRRRRRSAPATAAATRSRRRCSGPTTAGTARSSCPDGVVPEGLVEQARSGRDNCPELAITLAE